MKILLLLLCFCLLGCTPNIEIAEYEYYVSGSTVDYSVRYLDANNDTINVKLTDNTTVYKWTQYGARCLYLSAKNNKHDGMVIVKVMRNKNTEAFNSSNDSCVIVGRY